VSDPVRFLSAFTQSVATMALYGPQHPARARAVDAAYRLLRDLQAEDAKPEFSFLGEEVVYGQHPLREMRDWEWATRLANAGVQRLEFAADVSRTDFEDFLEDVLARLTLATIDTAEARPAGGRTSIRFGTLGIRGDRALTPPSAIEAQRAPRARYDLTEEVETVQWMHTEVGDRGLLPLMEAESVVRSLAVAMHAVNLTPFKLMDTVAIIGTGTIGLLTILAAKLRGAGKIIVTDLSEHRLDIAKKLGADVVVNVAKEDPVAVVQSLTNGRGAHAVIEAVGITATVKQSLALVRNGGNVTWIGNSDPEVTINMQQIVTREVTVRGTYGFNDEFAQSIETIRAGRINPLPLVEKIASLEQGTQIVNELAKGGMDLVKVILKP